MIKRKKLIKADTSIDYLLAIIEDARFTTIKRVENISTEELHWQYSEGWNTIGALLSHCISLSHYFSVYYILNRKFTAEEKEKYKAGLELGKYVPELITHQPIRFYIDALQDAHQQLCDAVKTLSQEDFVKQREGYDKETGCNLAWVLYHAAEDEVHHRGQISLLRKLYKKLHTV